MKYIKINIVIIILFIFQHSLKSQIIYNNGVEIYFNTNSIVIANGDVLNNAGDITNNGDFTITNNFTNNSNTLGDGNINLYGNWINNGTVLGNSTVNLTGANQNIEGTNITTFYNLNLLGTGIKTITLNTNVSNILNLNDRELSIGDNTCFILNTNINAIVYTSGFCSTSLNGGLSRVTNTIADYEYPLGSSITPNRFRPIYIKPTSSNTNTYKSSFINNNADINGFNRSQTDTGICNITPDFYHRIIQTSGSDSADISIKYSESSDGLWENIVRWNNSSANIWNKLQNTSQVIGTPYNTITIHHWSNLLNNEPIALAKGSLIYSLGNDTGFCIGGNVSLDAGAGYTSYQWSNGDTTQTISINTAGVYYITVSNGTCSAIDSIIVSEDNLPHVTIDKNKYICFGDTALINATGGGQYLWSNGDTSSTITVSPASTTQYILTVTNGYCYDTDTSIVFVNPLPIANAGNNQSICEGDTVTISASGSTNYLWNTGDTTNSINVSPINTTTYYVTVYDTLNCSAVDSVTVTTNTIPNITTSNDTSICNGDNIDIFALGGSTFLWNTSDTTSTINVSPTSSTNYIVTVSNGGCSNSDTININVNNLPNINIIASSTSICEGDSISLTANGTPPFLWNTGDTSQTINYYINSGTGYSVYVNDGLCSNSDSIYIDVSTKPISQLSDKDICKNDTTNLFANNSTTYNYLWNDSLNNMIITNRNNPLVFPQNTAKYFVTITNGACVIKDSSLVTVHDFPNAYIVQNDTTMVEGDIINLTVITDSTNSILWSPNQYLSNQNIYNPVSNPTSDITYYATVTDDFGCISSDSIKITIILVENTYPITIYNTFTPNNDGSNDFFHIENLEYYPINLLTIYNRDGHVVYQKNNYQNNWDGKYYGKDLPAATYYYVLTIPNINNNTYKGDITIIR